MKPKEFTVTDEFRYRGLKVPTGVCYIVRERIRRDDTTYVHLENNKTVTETKAVAQSIEISQESVDKHFTQI
jgi:hypothetical protein